MTLTPSQTSFDNVNFDNVNAGDILVGGIAGDVGGAVAGFFAATFSSVSFDNVFADDIVLGSSASSDTFSGLSFENVNADQIIIGGVQHKELAQRQPARSKLRERPCRSNRPVRHRSPRGLASGRRRKHLVSPFKRPHKL